MLLYRMRKNMKVIVIVICVAFVATLLYSGFGIPKGPPGPPATVAKVNKKQITREEFNNLMVRMMQQQEQQGGRMTAEQRLQAENQALDMLIDYNLVVQEAKRQKVKIKKEEIDKQIKEISDQFPDKKTFKEQLTQMGLSERKLRGLIEEEKLYEKYGEQVRKVKVTDKDVAAAFEKVNARHILIQAEKGKEKEAEKKAKEVLAKVKAGGDFAALAREHSDDPGSKENGGELGFFGQGQMVPEFEKAAFALKKNEVSDLVKTDYGYHIIQALDRTEAKGKEFEEQKKDLEAQVKERKGNEAFDQMLKDLKAKGKIEIKDLGLVAYRLWQDSKPKGAIAKYEEAIEAYAASPNLPYLHFGIAQVYKQTKNPKKELAHLKKAVEYNAGDASLELSLGMALKEQKKIKEALPHFEKAGELWPRDWQTHMTLYNLYQELEMPEKVKAEEAVLMDIQREYQERQEAQQKAQEEAERAAKEAEEQAKKEAAEKAKKDTTKKDAEKDKKQQDVKKPQEKTQPKKK